MRELTDEERARVEAALYEDVELTVALQTTEELHAFVEEWDGYGNAEPWGAWDIIRNPNLARGTALLLFWLSDPVYRFSKGDSPWGQLLVELQERYIAGFYAKDSVAINPREIAVGYWEAPNLQILIAEVMRQPTGQNE